MEIFTLVLAMATIFLAISSFLNIHTSNETLNIMRDDSLLVNRPYVFFSGKIRWDLEDDDTIKFTLNVENSGKSAAKNLDIHISRAVMLENKDIGNEIRNFNPEKIDQNDVATIQKQPFNVTYTIYPQQTMDHALSRISLKDLKKRVFNDKEALFIEISVFYCNLPFKKKQINYPEKHYFVFTGWIDSEGKLQGNYWYAYSE